MIIDVSTFPMYNEVLQRLKHVEVLAGSIMIPEFKPDGKALNHEFIAVGVFRLSDSKDGATLYSPYFIHKSDVGKYINIDLKGKYEKKKEN